ncbi:DEAD/DEAH box helicase [Taibaiella koreensis]|uniref:DEAD/DEAH box helicase n=1 Tax=Taibaiella koreensis TaxID=1268548 RepID=UPI000E59DEFB|nr:DEAD/DEAH box helicase [Taibaiella koreensis]
MTTFQEFGLKEELVQAVQALGFTTPSPIQQQAIPLLVQETTDIIALAQTGTGKTAAFGLPLLHKIDPNDQGVQALVLSPTRELCMQIQEEFVKYSKFSRGIHTLAVYGGTPIGTQIRELKRGNVQVVVATPGRLIDLLERNAVNLEEVKMIVLDEADEMLNMGFRDDIDFILKNTPVRESTWLFSATMNADVRRISKRYMKAPKEVAVAKENAGNENIDHQYFVTHAHQRFDALRRILDFAPDIYGIIFTRTKQDAQDVSEKLMREGYHVSALHGDMDQKMRTKVMERFKRRQFQAIVATDVAARGIDVNDITHVINYELPEDPEVYTHRSGRTGRAGKSGVCMSLVTSREIGRIRQVERMAKTRFHKSDIPDGAEVVRKRLFHFLDKIEEAQPEHGFGEIYKKSIHEKFEAMDKDELINRLLWLQLKDTIKDYENAPDLNAGYTDRRVERETSNRSGSVRLFINIGTKDGASVDSLIQFVAEMTDIEPGMVSRVTVRELSSFFNVPADAVEFIAESLGQRKFNNRKVRVEEADNKPGFSGGSGYGKPRDSYRKGGYEKKDYGSEPHKFTRARKPQNKY